jgi:phospholipid N-methyltransferase
MRYWQACGNFIREICRDFRRTGAVLPSSRFLAKALVTHLRMPRPPARILEVGAGTGAITSEIVRYLRPDDQLDVVEINARFVGVLGRRLELEWHFRRRRAQIRLIHSAVEDLHGTACYDYIVSCLPLNNFPAFLVRQIFQVYRRLLVPGGTLTFYEYVLLRQLKHPFAGRRERRRLYRVGRIVRSYVDEYQFEREQVFANFPPATVRHLHLKPPSAVVFVPGSPIPSAATPVREFPHPALYLRERRV